jgi:hypothetical protein
MQQPGEQSPQAMTFPNGTMFGAASNRQASSLAQIMTDSNNNNMQEFGELQAMSSKNQQTMREALQMLLQSKEHNAAGRSALSKRAHHCGLRDRSDSGAARIAMFKRVERRLE